MTTQLRKTSRYGILAFLALTFVLAGCGGPKLASVTGTVTYNGDPVTGGTLVFGPQGTGQTVPGKPATATIQSDGTFTLGTNRTADGAIVGRHRVTFTPPAQEMTEEQRRDPQYFAPPPPYMGLRPKTADVEIKPGTNTIQLELVH